MQWLYCWKSRGETAFLFWCHSLWKLASSNCCIFEMKHVTGMETCTEIYFLFIFNLVKQEFVKVRYFDFTIWWRHCENHLYRNCLLNVLIWLQEFLFYMTRQSSFKTTPIINSRIRFFYRFTKPSHKFRFVGRLC